ncbi:MaoC/PaaZ C-terminal domain-containing protein [Rhodococcus oxybenzonivorans]|nr:MaoC/PaaZ C-terminal domain-containing protein [Rhodococcus oxybenzonivorans]
MSTKISELSVGDTRESIVVRDLSRTQIVMYAGASGDFNPLHSDEVYSVEVAGYPTVIAHGQLTMGLAAKLFTDWIVDGELTGFGVRFQRQVWPGDTLTATATITAVSDDEGCRVVDLDLVTVNQAGQPVVTGYARLREYN